MARKQKNIALVAHDNLKANLADWVRWNENLLSKHNLICTGTTGKIIAENASLKVRRLKSGPLGGDQQLGAMIAQGKIDLLVFFWDAMEPQPHDVDVKALLRIATVYNVPSACNRASADYLISSPLFRGSYRPAKPDFSSYVRRYKNRHATSLG